MKHLARSLAAVALFSAIACADGALPAAPEGEDPLVRATVGAPGESVSSDILIAQISGDGVRLENKGSAPVFYIVAERGVLALMLFAPCTSTSSPHCTYLGPKEKKVVGASDIIGTAANAREFAVMHWRARDLGGGKAEPDSIRSIILAR